MNVFDVIVIVAIGVSVYFGFKTGVVASVFYVLSGFIGMWAAQTVSPEPGFKFYLVFLAAAAIVVLIGFFINRVLKILLLGIFDRLGGAVLGLLLGLVVVATVIFPISYHLPKNLKKTVVNSFAGKQFLEPLQKLFPKVKAFKIGDIKGKLSLPKYPDKLNIKIPLDKLRNK